MLKVAGYGFPFFETSVQWTTPLHKPFLHQSVKSIPGDIQRLKRPESEHM